MKLKFIYRFSLISFICFTRKIHIFIFRNEGCFQLQDAKPKKVSKLFSKGKEHLCGFQLVIQYVQRFKVFYHNIFSSLKNLTFDLHEKVSTLLYKAQMCKAVFPEAFWEEESAP